MKTGGADSAGGRSSGAKAATKRAPGKPAAAGTASGGGTKPSARAAGASRKGQGGEDPTGATVQTPKRRTGRAPKRKGAEIAAGGFSASAPPKLERFKLKLYVAGQSPRSVTAFANLRRICEEYLEGLYEIEVIDLLENPRLARGDQILAIPTLVRALPTPIRKIIGDLSNTERVLVGLNIRSRG